MLGGVLKCKGECMAIKTVRKKSKKQKQKRALKNIENITKQCSKVVTIGRKKPKPIRDSANQITFFESREEFEEYMESLAD